MMIEEELNNIKKEAEKNAKIKKSKRNIEEIEIFIPT